MYVLYVCMCSMHTHTHTHTHTHNVMILPHCTLLLPSSQFDTSTFQAILITDNYDTYAVFIYECGGMEWSGATIGWSQSSSVYRTHPLSGSSNSDEIGCRYSFISSAVIFRLEYDCEFSLHMYISIYMYIP